MQQVFLLSRVKNRAYESERRKVLQMPGTGIMEAVLRRQTLALANSWPVMICTLPV
jgi:hypothetical protein